jgi:hypothetical protein
MTRPILTVTLGNNERTMAKSLINGAPEEIRTPDPQIRSLGRAIEIIEFRYRKKVAAHEICEFRQFLNARRYRKTERFSDTPVRGNLPSSSPGY